MKKSEWNKRLEIYSTPSLLRTSIQIANSVIPYIGLNILLYFMYKNHSSLFLIIPTLVVTGGFMVRIFILFHDCTHLSYFKSRRANAIWGHILGILSYTPYMAWQHEHNMHHGAVGNLDKRGIGDIWTMTVEEYLASSKAIQGLYRLFRNPIFLFFVAPVFKFGVLNRIPNKKDPKKTYISYMITNLGVLAIIIGMSATIGWQYYFLIQVPTLFFASTMGMWLFFVQHQFEEVYWAEATEWDMVKAALQGSTFYKLPYLLNWISGSIGYHHIHHLSPRIPNYYLKACYENIAELEEVHIITLLSSFKLAFLNLYDHKSKAMINIKSLTKLKKQLS